MDQHVGGGGQGGGEEEGRQIRAGIWDERGCGVGSGRGWSQCSRGMGQQGNSNSKCNSNNSLRDEYW